MSKRTNWVVVAALAIALAAVGVAQAQMTPGRGGPMGPHTMRGGPCMMGPGMMGMGCRMMMPGADLKIERLENGVSIHLTSSDPKVASRIQKWAEIMRLMRELHQEEP